MTIALSTVRANDVLRQFRLTVTDVTLDNSYPTGGEAVTAAQLNLRVVQAGWCAIKTAATTAATEAFFDETNMKIKVNNTTGEVANGGDLTSVVVRVYALGY